MKERRLNRKWGPRRAVLFALLAAVLFLLAGCTAKVETELVLQPDFSGQRVMICYFKKSDLGNLSSGVENMVGKYCPPELTYEASSNRQYVIYTFTLQFSSKEEYTQKVESLLNHGLEEGAPRRTPTILYTRPDTVLMTGYRYSEDFTSADLLRWIDQAVQSEGGNGQEFSWEIGNTALNYDGKSVKVPQQISLDSITAYAVDTVEIDTTQREDGLFERKIAITFPQVTLDALGDELTQYLLQRIPQNGSGGWGEGERARTYTFGIPYSTADEIKAATQRILNGQTASLSYGEDLAEETALVERRFFEEELDLSGYASGVSNNAKLIYRFTPMTGNRLDDGGVYREGAWTKAGEIQNESRYTYQGEHNIVRLRVEFSQTHPLSGVEITLRHTLNRDLFEREIVFLFDSADGKNSAAYAMRYFNEIKPTGGAAVRETRGQYDVCRLTMKGSAAELTQMLSALFGEGNQFAFQNTQETITLKNHASIRDQIAMAAFLGGDNGQVPMTYTVRLGSSQQVESLTYSEQNDIKTVTVPDGAESHRFSIPVAGSTVYFRDSFINVLGVVAISSVAFIAATLLVLVVVSVVKRKKSHAAESEDTDTVDVERNRDQ